MYGKNQQRRDNEEPLNRNDKIVLGLVGIMIFIMCFGGILMLMVNQ